jgi:hypothetical protein
MEKPLTIGWITNSKNNVTSRTKNRQGRYCCMGVEAIPTSSPLDSVVVFLTLKASYSGKRRFCTLDGSPFLDFHAIISGPVLARCSGCITQAAIHFST